MEPRTDLTMLSPGWADDVAPKAAQPVWESDEESRPPPYSLRWPGLLSNVRTNIMDGTFGGTGWAAPPHSLTSPEPNTPGKHPPSSRQPCLRSMPTSSTGPSESRVMVITPAWQVRRRDASRAASSHRLDFHVTASR